MGERRNAAEQDKLPATGVFHDPLSLCEVSGKTGVFDGKCRDKPHYNLSATLFTSLAIVKRAPGCLEWRL